MMSETHPILKPFCQNPPRSGRVHPRRRLGSVEGSDHLGDRAPARRERACLFTSTSAGRFESRNSLQGWPRAARSRQARDRRRRRECGVLLEGRARRPRVLQRRNCCQRDTRPSRGYKFLRGSEAPSSSRIDERELARVGASWRELALRKNALTPPPLTRFRWHEPVLTHVGSRRRTVLGARRPRQVQDRKVFGCE